ncbi:organic cation transporter protein-like [Amblyomma americanum]
MSRAGSPRSGTPSASVSFSAVPATSVASTDEVQTGGPYGHGSYQRRTLSFGIAAMVVLLCHSQSFALISGPVDHWCKPPPQFSHLSVETWKNVGIPLDEEGGYSQCYAYVHLTVGNGSGPTETFACDAWDYDQRMARRTVRSFWNMVCHRSWLRALADAVYMSGALVLVPLTGYVADMSGRQPVITAAVMAVLFSALGSCCADTYFVYVATRFVSSGSASTIFVITFILIYEVTPFKYQASYLVLMNSIPFVCTNMFILVMVRLDLPWFWLQTVVLSPTLLLLSAFGVISESPLWLITMSRFREAEEVMKRAAKANGVKLEAAQQSVRRLRSQLKGREGSHTAVSPAVVVSAGQLRERAAIVVFVNFVVMLAFYRLVWAMLEHQDSEMVMVTDLCVGIPCYTALYIAINVAGRKQLLLFMLPLLGGLCSLCGVAVYARPWYFPYVLMTIAKQCSILTTIAHLVFTAELFPTSARCAVMCAAYACGRVGGIVASSLRLLKAYRREDVGFAIVGSAVFVCLVFVLRLPETSCGRQEHPNIEQRKDPLFLMQESLKPMPRASGHSSPRAARSARR